MDFDFGTYYESLTPSHRMDEEFIVSKAIDSGVYTDVLRYEITHGAYRGVIKSCDNKHFYFHFSPENDAFRLIEANTPDRLQEVGNILKSCQLGCGLKKAEGGGGDRGSDGFNTISEEDNIADQDDLTTDVHPGGATHVTPDSPHRGRMWHEEEVPPVTMAKSWDAGSLLDGLNDALRKSTSQLRRPISDQERQFMVEVLGRTPEQVQRGDVYMNPTQKVMYNQWVNKSMRSSMTDLDKWLKK